MTWSLVGSLGTATQGASGAAVTPAYGQTPTAGNLLALWVSGISTTTGDIGLPTAPSGWTLLVQKAAAGHCTSSIFIRQAVGSDAAPTVALVTGVLLACQLGEFNWSVSGVNFFGDQSGNAIGTTGTSLTVTSGGADAASGELILACGGAEYASAAAHAVTHSLNNGATATQAGNNNATSSREHYSFAYGITTGNSGADVDTVSINNTGAAAVHSAAVAGSIKTATPTQSSIAQVGMAAGADPGVYSGWSINLRGRVQSAVQATFRADLYQGATKITSATLESAPLTTSIATYSLPLLTADVSTITNFTTLSVKFSGYSSNGSTPTVELEDLWIDGLAPAAGGAVADTVTVSDSLSDTHAGGSAAPADSVTVSDVVQTGSIGNIADSVTVSDSVAGTPHGGSSAPADSVSVSDAVTEAASLSGAVADSVTVSDEVTVGGDTFVVGLADSVSVSDAVTDVQYGGSGAPADSVSVSDAVTGTGGGAFTSSPADTVTVSDAVTDVAHLSGATADTVSVSDAVSATAALSGTAADSVSVSDSLSSSAAGGSGAASDSVSVSDSVEADGGGGSSRSVADSVSVSDAASATVNGGPAAVADSVSVSDAATGTGAGGVNVADTVSVSDAASAAQNGGAATLADSVSVSDAASAVGAGDSPRSVADTVSVSDSATSTEAGGSASVSDTVSPSDSLGGAAFPSDTVSVSDSVAAMGGGGPTVPVADILQVLDSILNTETGGSSTVLDALSVSDMVDMMLHAGAGAPLVKHQEVVAGDDYKAEDGRALLWGPSQYWPDLAGAALELVVGHFQYNLYGNLPVEWTDTVPSSPDWPSTVSVDVLGSQTLVLPMDMYDYLLHATLTDGSKVTLAQGKMTVTADPGSLPLFPPAI